MFPVPQAGQNLSDGSTGQPQLGQGAPLGGKASASMISTSVAEADGAALVMPSSVGGTQARFKLSWGHELLAEKSGYGIPLLGGGGEVDFHRLHRARSFNS